MLRTDSANNIIMTQGNSVEINISPLDDEGNAYIMAEGDKVVFKAASKCRGEIKKVFTDADQDEEGYLILMLTPDDTSKLRPGIYDYDCIYIFADGSAYTFIDKAYLKILPAIAKAGDGDED